MSTVLPLLAGDAATLVRMLEPKGVTTAVKLIAAFWILDGIQAAIDIVQSLTVSQLSLNFGVFGVLIGRGLLQRKGGWRRVALILTGGGVILSPFVAYAIATGPGPIPVMLFADTIGYITRGLALGALAAVVAFDLWSIAVLNRGDVVELFRDTNAAGAES